jgi:hypothetical protein
MAVLLGAVYLCRHVCLRQAAKLCLVTIFWMNEVFRLASDDIYCGYAEALLVSEEKL